jgi:hypothetical protein
MTCFADGVVIAELSLTAVPVTVQAGTGHTTHLEHEHATSVRHLCRTASDENVDGYQRCKVNAVTVTNRGSARES